MGPARGKVADPAFGHIVVTELHNLASAEEVAAAIANIECDQPLGRQDGSNEGGAHAERFGGARA